MDKKLIHLISVTYQNYGSILQTYALQNTVRKLGYNTLIVAYCESGLRKFLRLLNKEYAETRFRMLIKHIRLILKGKTFNNNLKARSNSFSDFIQQYLFLSKRYTNLNDIKKDSYNWDTVLLGSDQVWHPINYEMHFFTLEFVNSMSRKIAYAPSFGVSTIPSKYIAKYERFLGNFTYLSCREDVGIDLIKKISGREATHVCDPTLLMTPNEWRDAFSFAKIYDNPYLFVYLMGNNANHRILAKKYADKNRLKIVALTHIDEYVKSDDGYADYTPFKVGPSEFLSLIYNASAVITDSFHASVFSLLFHKIFYTFNRFESGIGSSTTSRIDSLLSMAGVLERKVKNDATLKDMESIKGIEWEKVDINLSIFRDHSVQYLKTILA